MFLKNIMSRIAAKLEQRKQELPLAQLKQIALGKPPPLDLTSAIKGEKIKLIAEIKKASPSKGVIRPNFNHLEIAQVYADHGAVAISVLTEGEYFHGSLSHLSEIKNLLGGRLPLLRKDFIFDPYQIYESRAYGADSLLLIVAILKPKQLAELLDLSRELGMTCLVEVHNEAELDIALQRGAKIIGINNRDLNTFNVDLSTTERLRPLIPPNRLIVAESGIRYRSDVEKLKNLGINAILVGEALMASSDIAATMKEFMQ